MTALPSNLALVAEDLNRATLRDAKRSVRRRRFVTYAVAFALVALTATAAIANGWLFGSETPVIRVAPALNGGLPPGPAAPAHSDSAARDVTKEEAQHRAAKPSAPGAPPLGQASASAPRTLLAGLGSDDRVLTSVTTTSGGVCLTLTGFGTQCIPTFASGQDVVWFFRSGPSDITAVWGIVRDVVTGVDVVSTTGSTTSTRTANGAFYAELRDESPDHLILHLGNGSTESVSAPTCPLTTPDCTP
jgi:hypothetical protein